LSVDPPVTGERRTRGEELSVFLDTALSWASLRKDRLRRYGLAGALIVFLAGLYWAIQGSPEFGSELKIAPLLLLIALSAPLGTVLNTIELWALSRIAGGPMSWRTSLDLTVYTSAANMLPVPGGAITKLAGFRAHGVGYGTATAMIVLSFLAWGGLAFLYSAVALLLLDQSHLAGLFVIAGLAFLVATVVGFARFGHWRMVAIVAATRLVTFATDAVRYWLALTAIGVTASLLQCSALVVVPYIGASVVIVPSGLGVSEAAGALLATFVGIAAASGFISTAIQRIARLVGLALIAGAFMLRPRTPPIDPAAIPDRADIS
jgi:hypothetical protein